MIAKPSSRRRSALAGWEEGRRRRGICRSGKRGPSPLWRPAAALGQREVVTLLPVPRCLCSYLRLRSRFYLGGPRPRSGIKAFFGRRTHRHNTQHATGGADQETDNDKRYHWRTLCGTFDLADQSWCVLLCGCVSGILRYYRIAERTWRNQTTTAGSSW